MGLLSNKIEREELKAGDHIYSWRNGYLYSHHDKPPVEELLQFLEFQLPKQWAPVFGELALGPDRKQQTSASLQFRFMGPKLYTLGFVLNVCPIFSFGYAPFFSYFLVFPLQERKYLYSVFSAWNNHFIYGMSCTDQT